MLRNIPEILSPELVKILMEMGHGDEIVLADRNFPAAAKAQRLISYQSCDIPTLLKAILPIFPLDESPLVDYNVVLTKVPDFAPEPPIFEEYIKLLELSPNKKKDILYIQKPEFYAQSQAAYAIIATGETASFGNIIIRKGTL